LGMPDLETVHPTPEGALMTVSSELALSLKQPARLAACRQQLALVSNQEYLQIDWPTSQSELWQPRRKQNPTGEIIGSLEFLHNGLVLALSETQLTWLDRKGKVVRRHRHSAQNPTKLAVRHDSREVAIYSGVNKQLQLYQVECTAQSMLHSWFFQTLQPTERLAGGDQFVCYHPGEDLLVYNGQRSSRDHGLHIRQSQGNGWLSLPENWISTSSCGGHRAGSFSPEGAWLLISSHSGLYLISTTWTQVHHYPPLSFSGTPGTVAFSDCPNQDGSWLVSVSEPAVVNFYRLNEQGLSRCGECPGHLFSSQFIPSTQQLMATLWTGELYKFELQTDTQTRGDWPVTASLKWEPEAVHQEWMNSDSAEFISRSQSTYIQQVCQSGAVVALSNHIDRVVCFEGGPATVRQFSIDCVSDRLSFEQMALSPSGTRLAVGRRFQIKVWDGQTGLSISRWTGMDSRYYKDTMFALSFIDDNHLIAITSEGVEEYWDLDAPYSNYDGCPGSPTRLTAGAIDGRWIASFDGRDLRLQQLVPRSADSEGRGAYQLDDIGLWECQGLEHMAVSSDGCLAWIQNGKAWVQQQDQRFEKLLLPCGNELGQLFFLSPSQLVATRQGRTVVWNWQTDQTVAIQCRGQLLNVLSGQLVWRTPTGVEFCANPEPA
jgi:hypothetical protein